MQLLPGAITIGQLQKVEGSGENAGAETIDPTYSIVASVDLGTLQVGDTLFVVASIASTKGGTGGQSGMRISHQVTGVEVLFVHDLTAAIADFFHSAARVYYDTLATIGKVTVGGSSIIRLEAYSDGSDSSAAIGGCQLYCWVYRGTL